MNRTSPYYISIAFGNDRPLQAHPAQIRGTSITLDINSFLPVINLKISDSSRILSALTPLDINLSKLTFGLSRTIEPGQSNTIFKFDTFRRSPSSKDVYNIEGFMQVNNFFSPKKMRSFNANDYNISDILVQIAGVEFGFDETEISDTLDYGKTLIQPSWTNAEFLNHLKANVLGTNDEGPFFNFAHPVENQTRFVFKSLKELFNAPVKYKFTNSTKAYKDPTTGDTHYPVLRFRAFDNYKYIGVSGCKKQQFSYFDYDTSTYTNSELTLANNSNANDDYLSLTNYHSIDNNDSDTEVLMKQNTGRSNSLTSDFKAIAKNEFHRKLVDLNKLWISTWGFEDLYPGDLIELKFLSEIGSDQFVDYIYSGIWMVERVVHALGDTFVDHLLLTRDGVNFEQKTTLIKTAKQRK